VSPSKGKYDDRSLSNSNQPEGGGSPSQGMGGELGLVEATSIALGGMIGGGIYAVLGVVVGITGPTVSLAFVLAGIVAGCAAYSYNALNGLDGSNQGGSVTFVQSFVGNSTAAGMVGWTLLVGYVGSMAMYAFAFGEFAVGLAWVPDTIGAIPARPLVSLGAIAGFLGLNLVGARATGVVENALVAVKILVLLAFAIAGLVFAGILEPRPIDLGIDGAVSLEPIMAAAISFVAFQGWQLLFYDQESIEDAVGTIRQATAIAIPVAVAVYVLVAIATVTLAPQAITENPHTALATAAGEILAPWGLAWLGALAISLSALVSTGSAINATLFSGGYFAKGMVNDELLPDRVGDPSVDGVPSRTLLVLAVLTGTLTVIGTLDAITAFASLSFIVVFGIVSAIAVSHREQAAITASIPAAGVLGTAGFLVLMLYHLYTAEFGTFVSVIVLAVLVVIVELLYFERAAIESEIEQFEAVVLPSGDATAADGSATDSEE